ncbi:hypothetical protein Sjap_020717 [Stephania japonica]|uniref:Cucumisin n=1 Tax=Stephania japonica TaxID=461633 RepID=A0AAP0F8J7_9MAGN
MKAEVGWPGINASCACSIVRASCLAATTKPSSEIMPINAFMSVLLGEQQIILDSSSEVVHIVYMGERPEGSFSVSSVHHSMLEEILGSSSSAKDSIVYSYGRSFNGFAAKLSDDEVARLSEMEGVVSVFPNTKLKLHTTRSWDFLGFTQPNYGAYPEGDVIVGLLDTGVWPESKSFDDEGFGPPPSKWKGACKAKNFTCNNKLIGARFYNSDNEYDVSDIKSPRDTEGHGSHTASTVAGREVEGVSFFGLANGTARGGVPNARIAVYKVCWAYGCALADILAGFDDAIADGVDIISVSLGADSPLEYFEDPIAIGAFHAMKKGILTSNSAGNSGPFPRSVSNYSPWTLTVAASTIDRKFETRVALGNGQSFSGPTINSFVLNGTSYPLIWGGDAPNVSAGFDSEISTFCFGHTLNSLKTEGKIIYCEGLTDGAGVILAKGLGTIMSDIVDDLAFAFPLPAAYISIEDGQKVLDYIKTSDNPIATILVSETPKDAMAPRVVSFSSRGPNPVTYDILKPDITAPGVDILAAWSPLSSPSGSPLDTRVTNYNIISGTSMSCPHASGAAAYVKAAHPNWSPAAIKSALMTTATLMDPNKNLDKEFAYGSGQINPVKAVNPGLVFDAKEADYVDFLCKQGYSTSTLRLVTGDFSVCKGTAPGKAWSLNYPSFSLSVPDGEQIMGTFTRTVTNVGSANSTYYASAYMPSPVGVKVVPPVLRFKAVGEKKSFTIMVYGPKIVQQPVISGLIMWNDGSHLVRTPIVVFTVLPSIRASSLTNPFPSRKRHFEGSSIHHKNRILGRN